MKKSKPAEEVDLIPFALFKKNVKQVLHEDKQSSDRYMARFQAANVKKREARKKRKVR